MIERTIIGSMRLLIVENEPDLADTLGEILRAYGYEVRTVYSGSAAILVAPDYRPDVLICDLGMPQVDGLAVCRALRGERELLRTRFIAWSGCDDPELEEDALATGYHAVLHKPVFPDEWRQILEPASAPHDEAAGIRPWAAGVGSRR